MAPWGSRKRTLPCCQGEAVRPFVLDSYARKVLIGEDGFNRERIWNRLYRMQRGSGGQLSDRAIGYVDQALWDLAGRKLGVPVWKLLGGARSVVPAYGSTMCGDELEGGVEKVCGLTGGVRFWGVTPRGSGDEARDLREGEAQAARGMRSAEARGSSSSFRPRERRF